MDGHSLALLAAAAVLGIALGYAFSLILAPVKSKNARRRESRRQADSAPMEQVDPDGGRVIIL